MLQKDLQLNFWSSWGWNTLHDFCPEFPLIYSLDKSTLVAESQSQSADLSLWWSQTFLTSDYDSLQSEDIKYVYFKPILEHIVFICHAISSNKAHASAGVCAVIGRTLKSSILWSSVV